MGKQNKFLFIFSGPTFHKALLSPSLIHRHQAQHITMCWAHSQSLFLPCHMSSTAYPRNTCPWNARANWVFTAVDSGHGELNLEEGGTPAGGSIRQAKYLPLAVLNWLWWSAGTGTANQHLTAGPIFCTIPKS